MQLCSVRIYVQSCSECMGVQKCESLELKNPDLKMANMMANIRKVWRPHRCHTTTTAAMLQQYHNSHTWCTLQSRAKAADHKAATDALVV